MHPFSISSQHVNQTSNSSSVACVMFTATASYAVGLRLKWITTFILLVVRALVDER